MFIIRYERKLAPTWADNELLSYAFHGRYALFLMGLFALYCGWLYNDCFSMAFNLFPAQSGWTSAARADWLPSANASLSKVPSRYASSHSSSSSSSSSSGRVGTTDVDGGGPAVPWAKAAAGATNSASYATGATDSSSGSGAASATGATAPVVGVSVYRLVPNVPLRPSGKVYPFGIDPIWHVANNDLVFLNSVKMKLSVVLGVFHMTFGIR